ncbi:restriction endonuclease subunit S [Mycoavidus sp. SF9855]|uniref:restriction endonuclease subunit S n=1 Tax=Mycoavidus sp. SF9855 TaxID=2968475 RepID=UPI00211CEAAA|nr:restriction endonuclease subunit S [Mycoavidus sp. SF9855]UUM21104.1 restriction endonuclease subunit S [Mycoavidus sp. SF9855]
MSNKASERLVPKLRFPEFRDSGDWCKTQLHEVALFVNEKVALENLSPERYLSTENLLQDFMGMVPSPTRPSAGSATRFKIDDVLISNIRPYLKKVWVAEIEGGTSNDVIVIRAKKEVTTKYLSHLLKSDLFIEYVMTGAKGVKMPRGDVELIKKFIVATPTKPDEQKKIADCLSSIDNFITAQIKKIEVLKVHKKGLMQQLFPAEGETVPRLRFTEFQSAPEWKEKSLSEISPVIFDGTHQTPKYTTSGIPFFSVENLVSGAVNKYISQESYDFDTRKNKPCKGDILLTRIGKIGYSKLVDWDYDFAVYVTLAVIAQSESFSSRYLHFYLQSSFYQREILSKSLLNAVPCKINMGSLRETKVCLPSDLGEQEKIGVSLASFDDLIALHTQKLEVLKANKKGLMQCLFPSTFEGDA